MNLRKANQACQRGVQLINDLSSFHGAALLAILVRHYICTLGETLGFLSNRAAAGLCLLFFYFDLQDVGKQSSHSKRIRIKG